ncbi:MAG: hypothetical protein L6R35_000447 [Caloplaca aegaea]|nr:MAG: hypothetical protein L6R35_000447 [Caloplaca aegaea]
MHKPPLAPVVYSWLYPNPKPTDPPNFQTYISKQLVPEVRAETARFYGHIDCAEAQYPGLDYAAAAHRLRLNRFPYHRRLFQVFDQLRLTNHEIQTICKWEGTRWARERYEKDVGGRVRETTWDDIIEAIPASPTVTRTELRQVAYSTDTMLRYAQRQESWPGSSLDDPGIPDQSMHETLQHMDDGREEESDRGNSGEDADNMGQEVEESEDELQQSVGVELNQRLMAATEARDRGEEAVLDADWEQWLKEAAEGGAEITVANARRSITMSPTRHTPQLLLEANSPRVPVPAGFPMPATANSMLGGPSAPPAGTAL